MKYSAQLVFPRQCKYSYIFTLQFGNWWSIEDLKCGVYDWIINLILINLNMNLDRHRGKWIPFGKHTFQKSLYIQIYIWIWV